MPSISEKQQYTDLIKQWRYNTIHCSLMEDKLVSEQVKHLLELPNIKRLLIEDVMDWSVFQNRPLYDILVLLRIVLKDGPYIPEQFQGNLHQIHMIWTSWIVNYEMKKYLNGTI